MLLSINRFGSSSSSSSNSKSFFAPPILYLLLTIFFINHHTTVVLAAPHDNKGDVANCPGEWGVTPCVAPSEFSIVPENYSNLPLLDLSTKWAPLQPLKEFDYGSIVKLELTPAYYLGPSYNTPIVTYNGMSPPPIIRVKAGDDLKLSLKNRMSPPLGNNVHNEYRLPNTTNIHTHGGHISGNSPGDSVKVTVNPFEEHDYLYDFPNNHMPGTAWYHPHFHGSTAIQTGQGAAGMLIVDDPPGYLPKQIEDMEEINLMIQHLNIDELKKFANTSGFEWWIGDSSIVYGNATTQTGNTNMMLLNMQYIPKITVQQGKWYRMRMVMSSTMDGLTWTAPKGCELQLLAKDGIYLTDAPRKVDAMILAPGNRADVAMKCDIDPGVYKMPSVSRGRFFNPVSPNDQGYNVPATCGFCITQPDVAALEVIAGNGKSEPDIEPFGKDLQIPCYLADLTKLPEEEVGEEFTINYGPGLSVNGVSWTDEFTYTKNFTMGTVQQFYLTNNGGHPHHQHVNPFQILEIENRTLSFENEMDFESWYKDGNWQDTLQHISKDAKSRVRWAVNEYNKDMIFHCHILVHEDQGMMGQFYLEGEEGTYFEGARLIDPTCALSDEFLISKKIEKKSKKSKKKQNKNKKETKQKKSKQ